MTHTPGPWFQRNRGKSGALKFDVLDHGGFLLIAANCAGPDNARLIAAAPALLEACQRLLEEGKCWESANNDFARAAILLATGEDPK